MSPIPPSREASWIPSVFTHRALHVFAASALAVTGLLTAFLLHAVHEHLWSDKPWVPSELSESFALAREEQEGAVESAGLLSVFGV